MEVYVAQFMIFLMILVRVTSLIITAPLMGHQAVPVEIKVGLGLFVSYVLFPVVVKQNPALDLHIAGIMLIALKEVLVGVVIGFSLGLVFAGVRYGGELMSFSMGFSMSNVVDPESGQNTPVLGEFMYLSTLLLFLVLNGHHFVFESLFMTFQAIPIGTAALSESMLQILLRLTGLVFVVAIKIAAPVLVAGFLVNVGLSILARVMPQANIFMLSFPITIGVGLLVILSSVPFLVLVFKKLLTVFESSIVDLMRAM